MVFTKCRSWFYCLTESIPMIESKTYHRFRFTVVFISDCVYFCNLKAFIWLVSFYYMKNISARISLKLPKNRKFKGESQLSTNSEPEFIFFLKQWTDNIFRFLKSQNIMLNPATRSQDLNLRNRELVQTSTSGLRQKSRNRPWLFGLLCITSSLPHATREVQAYIAVIRNTQKHVWTRRYIRGSSKKVYAWWRWYIYFDGTQE